MGSPVVDWLVQLDAENEWDLTLLVEHFRSDECKVVREEDGNYYLRSHDFRGIQDRQKVIEAARPLMEHMNGIAKVIAPWFRPVNSDKLTSIHENGNRGVALLAGPIRFRLPSQIPSRELLPGKSNQVGKAETWIDVAKNDQRVANALRIFGVRPPTWSNLYNLYEIVREDIGSWQQIVTNGWATDDELKRFRKTANDPNVIGDDARHQKEPPAPEWSASFQPMSHEEAKALLHRLLESWLASKT